MKTPRGATEAFLRKYSSFKGGKCVLWPFGLNNSGYGLAVIDGKQGIASRLMCIMVHGRPRTRKHEAAHSCGRRPCINPNHISWKTRRQNQRDRLIHGTAQRGEASPLAKLTASEVKKIRRLATSKTATAISKIYNISRWHVVRIVRGERWGHLL